MKDPNRTRKSEIKYNVALNEEQKQAKQLIIDNQIVIITGRAGSGKSLGFLPGDLKEKFNPYMEALVENLYKCTDRLKVDEFVKNGKIQALPIQFIRGKTIDDILIVEEAQNLTKGEMEAILTRLGTTGKIVINGDSSQRDTSESYTGLDFAIELSKNIEGIHWIKLQANHRSGLVGKILDYIYGK